MNQHLSHKPREPKLRSGTGGFTLVETLVAIAIVLVVLLAPFQVVENSLMASYSARDKLIANSLAQEGVEFARRIRDNNYLTNYSTASTVTWLQGLDGSNNSTNCLAPRLCTVDPTQLATTPVSQCYDGVGTNNCPTLPLYLSSGGSIYPYMYNQSTTGSSTRFYRTVQLCYIGGANCSVSTNEAKVTVVVTWATERVRYTTTVVDYLENWQ